MAAINIQGINCTYRDKEYGEEVLYENLPQEEQYFRRAEYPFDEDEIDEMAKKELRMSETQQKWVDKEKKRIIYGNGVYARINGNLTYIPASYWCYINHWTLEHGEKPEYREADRIFFLFMEFLYFETKVTGLTRGKGRRQGASSLGYFFMWWICGRLPEKEGGSMSFNDEAAQNNFSKMFMRGFKALLPCFVEDFDSNSDNFVRFRKPADKEKKGTLRKREGLNSYCGYLPNSINSYDSGRLSFGLFDETGKYHKININTYWSKVSPTLKKGRKKLGFAYMPTTVNPEKQGGENYKQFWSDADQNKINPETGEVYGLNTPHGVVRYFVPATEGYSGCIDKFGNSVIDDPAEPIMGNDGDWITEGAMSVILKERALKSGEQLLEHRRDFPLDEFDMFSFSFGICEFNEDRLRGYLKALEEKPVYLRQCRLLPEIVKKKNIYNEKEESWQETRFMDDKAGGWLLFEKPEKENHYNHRGKLAPLNSLRYVIGVDTVKDSFAVNGSNATIVVFKKSYIVQGIEKGLYPVLIYAGKPRLLSHLWEDVLLACMWYGCKVNFEIDAGTSYYDYFLERDALSFLEWTPRIAIDVANRRPVIKPGTQSANPFQLAAQLECCKKYIDGTLVDGYNGNGHRIVFPKLLTQLLEYEHANRTKSDLAIGLMMALLPCFGSTDYLPTIETKPKRWLPTYKIKMPA